MTDDLAYWGATDEDTETLPRPETRRIGERLYVRPRGMEPGETPARLPLRLHPAFMQRAIAEGDGVEQLALIVDELADDVARDVWAELDHIDRVAVARDYFAAVEDLLGMAVGESSR